MIPGGPERGDAAALPASVVMLAGGQSRRMGQPKAALPFNRLTILERMLAELHTRFDDLVVLAAPAEVEPFPIEQLLRTVPGPTRILRDSIGYQGPAAALARGLEAACHEVVFACSCDLPLLRAEVASALCRMLQGHDAVIPEIGGRPQPLCAAYRRRAAAIIVRRVAAGERRLSTIVSDLNAVRPGEARIRPFDPELRSFFNVNTRQDYIRALALERGAKA